MNFLKSNSILISFLVISALKFPSIDANDADIECFESVFNATLNNNEDDAEDGKIEMAPSSIGAKITHVLADFLLASPGVEKSIFSRSISVKNVTLIQGRPWKFYFSSAFSEDGSTNFDADDELRQLTLYFDGDSVFGALAYKGCVTYVGGAALLLKGKGMAPKRRSSEDGTCHVEDSNWKGQFELTSRWEGLVDLAPNNRSFFPKEQRWEVMKVEVSV